jgi:hypothetical protein
MSAPGMDTGANREMAAKRNLRTAFDDQSQQPMQTGAQVGMQQMMPPPQQSLEDQARQIQTQIAQLTMAAKSAPPQVAQQYIQMANMLQQHLALLQSPSGMNQIANPDQPPAQNAAGPAPGAAMMNSEVGANNATPGVGRGGSAS